MLSPCSTQDIFVVEDEYHFFVYMAILYTSSIKTLCILTYHGFVSLRCTKNPSLLDNRAVLFVTLSGNRNYSVISANIRRRFGATEMAEWCPDRLSGWRKAFFLYFCMCLYILYIYVHIYIIFTCMYVMCYVL
jgi:hypothetical protein